MSRIADMAAAQDMLCGVVDEEKRMFNPIVRAEEIAYNEAKRRILDGRLAPGTRLVHRVLANELGVSSSPVVLALRMLERDGLVVNTPGLGACVRNWTRDEIVDSYRIRAFHEALAARLCAERALSYDLEAIRAANEAIKRSVDAQDSKANVWAELDFHLAIARGANCPDLQRLYENLSIVHRSMTAFGISLNVPRLLTAKIRDNHDPIVEAIRLKEPDMAERAAREHVEDSLARNLAWIEEVTAAIKGRNSPRPMLRTNKPIV
ncbi:MAG: GntR family transcriptional regulator [Armatimonadota bacterium]